MAALILTTLALCQLTLAQFVSPPTNLTTKAGNANVTVRYKEVPAGVCEQNPNIKSYSGYADVAPNQHIFWWFFEARNVDPTTAPLTVWINGGPGSSSMIGLFQELGPCTVNASGGVVDNPYSWSNASNMLFIDQPTQTGFSYSSPVPGYLDPDFGNITVLQNATCPENVTTCGTYSLPDLTLTANSTVNAAPNMYRTLQGFMGAFPQYSQGDFFFATESYGGHYGPIFNQYFLQQNQLNASGTVPIKVKGVLIGNGWFDPLTAYAAYYNYTVTPGNTYITDFYNSSTQEEVFNSMYGQGNCSDQIKNCYTNGTDEVCSAADSFCFENVEYPYDLASGRDEYDVRYLTPDPFPPTFYVDYLNTPEVQAAIGAFVNYSEGSPTVGMAFSNTGDDARVFDIPSAVGNLVSQNVTVVIYYGDADYICNWVGGIAFLPQITPAPPSFNGTGFAPILTNSSNSTHPRGEVRQAGHFAFARIYESGHEVPFYQPELSLEMFSRVVRGVDIATGNSTALSARTQGNMTTTYREGNATVQYDVVPKDAVYDWETSLPILPANATNSSTSTTTTRRHELAVRLTSRNVVAKNRDIKARQGIHHRAQGGKRHRRSNIGRL